MGSEMCIRDRVRAGEVGGENAEQDEGFEGGVGEARELAEEKTQ